MPSPEQGLPTPPSRPSRSPSPVTSTSSCTLAALLEDRGARLGPIARALAGADLAMVNLESAITERGVPDPKELEAAADRYWFRTLAAPPSTSWPRPGVDVVSVANNHGADYGPIGLRDTLRAAGHGPLAVVGVGRNRREAFTPYDDRQGHRPRRPRRGRVAARGCEQRLGRRPDTPGLAAAHEPRPARLLRAVRAADRDADVVVVYLHWGEELRSCPTAGQRTLAAALVRRGRRRRRRQPRARPARCGPAGRQLRELRARELRLVPHRPAGDRCPPAADRGRRGRVRRAGPGADRDVGRAPRR